MRITTSKCPSVGLLVDWLAHGYQDDVIEGVKRAASQRGANLFVFVGGSFLSEALAEANNTAFACARRPAVDGVVALSGTLVNPLGAGACERILASLGVPVVSVGVPIESGSHVGVDNRAGLTALCEHLVEAHQARHIAMIAGPEESHESEERIAACRETLARYDITLRESHVTRQGFWLKHGRQGVVELLDRRRLRPGQLDAIVCASDLLAEGALEELAARGLRVPDDVKLTGFDGIDRGRHLSAPLTTVQQPFVELGCAAGRSLLQKLDGATVPDSETVSSRLLIRGSCGCASGQAIEKDSVTPLARGNKSFSSLVGERTTLGLVLARAAQGGLSAAGSGWEERWLTALFDDLRGGKRRAFLAEIGSLLRKSSERQVVDTCRRVLVDLRRQVLHRTVDPHALRQFEDAMHEAMALTSATVERLEVSRRLQTTGALYSTLQSVQHLTRVVGEREFWPMLADELKLVGIHTALISRCIGDGTGGQSRVELAFSEVEPFEALAGELFATDNVLPASALRRARDYPLVVRSLVHGGVRIGTVVLSLTAGDSAMYETFASVVAVHLTLESAQQRPSVKSA